MSDPTALGRSSVTPVLFLVPLWEGGVGMALGGYSTGGIETEWTESESPPS